jgi:hypothetical protein
LLIEFKFGERRGRMSQFPGVVRRAMLGPSSKSNARALWRREEARAPGPVRGEEPRSVCKCEGPPSGATATVPRGTRSAASSRSSLKSKARALWRREEARGPGPVRGEGPRAFASTLTYAPPGQPGLSLWQGPLSGHLNSQWPLGLSGHLATQWPLEC